MLEILQQRIDERGIGARCTLHEGYLESLHDSSRFDGATSLLVSHFLVDLEQRRAFFGQIAERLHPGAPLVSADIASDMSGPAYEPLLEIWLRALAYADMPPEKVRNFEVRSAGRSRFCRRGRSPS